MQSDDSNTVLFYPTPFNETVEGERGHYLRLQTHLNYMASRLHAALISFAKHDQDENSQKWWLEGFRYEMTAALAVAGDALTSNIYLDIPPLIRGLQHCFLAARPGATKISLHQQMLTMLREVKPDPRNPSSVVNEYSHAWWTQAGKGEMKRHELIDSGAAFEFHQDKYGPIRTPRRRAREESCAPPAASMPPNPCDSLVCKAQIQAAYVKIKEINHVVRTLAVDIENARAQAQRHEHHVKYLTKCMSEVGGQRLDDDALRKLMFDAGGEYPVFKVPENLSIISSEHSIDRSLAEESLSSDGMEMDRI